MTTYRERREARVDRLREWAEKREKKSGAGFSRARQLLDGIPLGQPILVGHHSEKRHRAHLAKADNAMRAGVENSKKAEEMSSRAANIESALERAIYDDDPDAIERLEEKAADLEAKRDRMKAVNAAFKKGNGEALEALGFSMDKLKAQLSAKGSYWGSKPFLPYELTNLGATIRKARERIEIIKQRHARAAEVDAAGGFKITRHPKDTRYDFVPAYCAVQFSEKPSREIINALKAAGFTWARDRWQGQTDKLPACVLALEGGA